LRRSTRAATFRNEKPVDSTRPIRTSEAPDVISVMGGGRPFKGS
jgi:hypothetical protein